jgi:hypothetical protein
VTSTTANVQWNAVGGTQGYTLRYRKQSSTSWTSFFVPMNTYTFSGLDPSTGYVVQVRSVCSTEIVSVYASANFTTAGASSAVCDNPSPVTIMPAVSSALITWPQVPGATMYQVGFRRNVPGTGWTTVNRSPNTPNHLMTGLLPETEYEVTVRSICGTTRVPLPPSLYFTTLPMTRKGHIQASETQMAIYPNPNKGAFSVYFSTPLEVVADVSLVNAEGRKVYAAKQRAVAGENVWPVDVDLSAGLYLLRLDYAGQMRTAKVVVE